MFTRSQRKRKLKDVKRFKGKLFINEDRPTQLRSGKTLFREPRTKRKRKHVQYTHSESYVQILPNKSQAEQDLALYLCFKYLAAVDLINSQYVCQQWNRVIQDLSLWREKVLILENSVADGLLYKKLLVNAPLIQNIEIPRLLFWPYAHMQEQFRETTVALRTILLHQKDVRSLKADIFHLDLMCKLVAKFKNLESLTLGIFRDNLVTTLRVLRSCEKLLKLHVVHPFRHYGNKNLVNRILPNGFRIAFLLGDYFTSIRDLDLTYLQSVLRNEDIIYIIEKKINQLAKLKLMCDEDTSPKIFELISDSQLLGLSLKIYAKVFDLIILKKIKSLSLELGGQDLDMETWLKDTVLPNVTNLLVSWEDCFIGEDNNTHISLKSTVTSFPSAKCITIDFLDESNLNDELAHLSGFPYLKTVCLTRAYDLNVNGVSHLTECSGLESLAVDRANMTRNLLKTISRCSNLKHLELNGFWRVNTDVVLFLISSLNHLKSLRLSPLDEKSYPGISILAIKRKCEKRNISLEIKDSVQQMYYR